MCISEWQVDTVPPEYPGRVYLLPNSLEPQPRLAPGRIRELRSEFGAADDDYLIGAVGRLAPSKGFDVLVRAFESARLPRGRLVIVGEGSERGRLRRLAGDRVSLVGFRRDVKDLYQAFDLFVSPSHIEPFGRVIVEALDGGTPVIATDAHGPRDIARRYPIEIVPRDDVDALAGALEREAGLPRRRLNVDLSEFRVEQIAGRMISAYRDVIAAQDAVVLAHRQPAPIT
jgi:glycosyltransferase involved in cell wall biosynthesis